MNFIFALLVGLGAISAYAEVPFKAEDFVSILELKGREFQKSEVTYFQWNAVKAHLSPEVQMPWESESCKLKYYPGSVGPNFPVACVTYDDAQAYIRALNSLDQNYVYRLPTGDELNFLVKKTRDSLKIYDDYIPEKQLSKVAWYDSNSESHAHEVCTKQPVFGLCDILGNVWERGQGSVWNDGFSNMPQGNGWSSNSGQVGHGSFMTSDYGRMVEVGFRLVRISRR